MKLIRTSLSPPADGGGRGRPSTGELADAAEDEMLSTPCKRHKRSPQPTDSMGAAPARGEAAGGSPEVSCGGGLQAGEEREPGTPTVAGAAGSAGAAAMPPPPPRAPHARRPGLAYASAPTPGGSVPTPAAAAEVPPPPAQLPLPGAPGCYLMPKLPVTRQLFAAAAEAGGGAVGVAAAPAQPTAEQQVATQAFLSAMEDQVFLDFSAAFLAAQAQP